MKKNRKLKVVVAYVVYPIGFILAGSLLWLLAGEPVYQKVETEIRVLITDNQPKTSDIN